jgi:hypothetical protein
MREARAERVQEAWLACRFRRKSITAKGDVLQKVRFFAT